MQEAYKFKVSLRTGMSCDRIRFVSKANVSNSETENICSIKVGDTSNSFFTKTFSKRIQITVTKVRRARKQFKVSCPKWAVQRQWEVDVKLTVPNWDSQFNLGSSLILVGDLFEHAIVLNYKNLVQLKRQSKHRPVYRSK